MKKINNSTASEIMKHTRLQNNKFDMSDVDRIIEIRKRINIFAEILSIQSTETLIKLARTWKNNKFNINTTKKSNVILFILDSMQNDIN
jgi:hypothetical protein